MINRLIKAGGEKIGLCDAKNESRLKATYNINWDAFNCVDEFPFTAAVGKFVGNVWGLHDMLRNVWEWNQDCYIDSYEGAPVDGSPWEPAEKSNFSLRVLRGGSWNFESQLVRSAFRSRSAPDGRGYELGFRLARTL